MALNITIVGAKDRQISEFLRIAGMNITSITVRELDRFTLTVERVPDALVVDLRDEPSLPPMLAAVKRQHPDLGVVIVASQFDPALMLEAMRAGASEWVSEPLDQVELKAAIERVCRQRHVQPAAPIFAFIGAKGGVGTTTIAVNVATALRRLTSQSTLLIDLNLACGDASLFLGVEPRFSVVDAIENRHRLDSTFFHGLVVSTKAGPDLLASCDRATVGHLDIHAVSSVIDFASREYGFVVLDVPRGDSTMLDQLELATAVTVVVNQELATVRAGTRLASALRQRYGKTRVNVVISRYDKASDIGKDDIARTVSSPIKHLFPSDYRAAVEALNVGRPLAVENNTRLAASFAEFARSLAGPMESQAEPTKTVGLLSRISGRR